MAFKTFAFFDFIVGLLFLFLVFFFDDFFDFLFVNFVALFFCLGFLEPPPGVVDPDAGAGAPPFPSVSGAVAFN